MKFYLNQINDLLTKIEKGTIKALLLYGPDKGYISRICEIIIKKNNFFPSVYTYQNILGDGHLQTLLNNKNFFKKTEFIKINFAPSNIEQKIKLVLATEYINFPVFIGDELTTNSSMRNYFEKEESFAALGCYHDEEQNIVKLILKKCQEVNKSIEAEALTFLKLHLKGDHKYVISELEKLIFFTHDQKKITYTDVKEVISNFLASNNENLCSSLCQKNVEVFLKELHKLKEENINEILIIRSIIRYFINLYIVLLKIEKGGNMDEVIKSLNPPIFFKHINDFKKNLKSFTSDQIIFILSILQNSEIILKKEPNLFDFYQEIYLKIYPS